MKFRIITVVALLGLGACQTGCGTIPGTGGPSLNGDQLAAAMKDIAMDPNCGHTDTLNVILGPVPSGSLFLQRQCPGPAAKAAAAVGVQSGSFDGPPPSAPPLPGTSPS